MQNSIGISRDAVFIDFRSPLCYLFAMCILVACQLGEGSVDLLYFSRSQCIDILQYLLLRSNSEGFWLIKPVPDKKYTLESRVKRAKYTPASFVTRLCSKKCVGLLQMTALMIQRLTVCRGLRTSRAPRLSGS